MWDIAYFNGGTKMLDHFNEFLVEYRKAWNSCKVEEIMNYTSRDFKARWADVESVVSDWGYQEAYDGWEGAYSTYEGRGPEWHFEDVSIEINQYQEAVAVFWVRFKIDGSILPIKKLFIEAFRIEDGQWKKIREYVELPIKTEE
jgi:hypothetical protein